MTANQIATSVSAKVMTTDVSPMCYLLVC